MKRLVVCCDGTWQKLINLYPTNVVKIAQAIKPIANDGVPQVVFYQEGIGTGSGINKLGGGAFGWGIDQNIEDAYRFLCLNYDPGDEIYLFGFSRGAYIVRSLAGLIYCSGLLTRSNIRKAPLAYQLYRDRAIKPRHSTAINFRQKYGENVPITLLGCWDTVGALGVPDLIPFLPIDNWINEKHRFFDTVLNRCIQHALHAVAIDEQRKVFNVTSMERSEDNPNQDLRQVWFPGEHGCVGGGTKETRGLSDGALQWMMDQIEQLREAHCLGLDLNSEAVEDGIHPDCTVDFDNELHGIYVLTGQTLREVTGSVDNLHESVKNRWQAGTDYRPKNLEVFQKYLEKNSATEATGPAAYKA